MKYVLKESSNTYVSGYHRSDMAFTFTRHLTEAKQFEAITEILNVIADRARRSPGYNTLGYTIVGVKEVSTPSYEEVAL